MHGGVSGNRGSVQEFRDRPTFLLAKKSPARDPASRSGCSLFAAIVHNDHDIDTTRPVVADIPSPGDQCRRHPSRSPRRRRALDKFNRMCRTTSHAERCVPILVEAHPVSLICRSDPQGVCAMIRHQRANLIDVRCAWPRGQHRRNTRSVLLWKSQDHPRTSSIMNFQVHQVRKDSPAR